MYLTAITPNLTFSEAASLYLKLRSVAAVPGAVSARHIRRNTERDYQTKLRSVALFFGDTRLQDIHWYSIKAYQSARIAGCEPFIRLRQPHRKEPQACPAKPKQVNQELTLLKQIMTRAGCWTAEDAAYFEHLQEEESDAQRSLTPEEQRRWLDTCYVNERWSLILWWSVTAFHTCMSTNELRGLRLGDVNVHQRMIRVPWSASKNRYRHRDIAIEDADTLWAIDKLLARAFDMGSKEPQHYLFPFKITRSKTCVPERPMTESGIKKLWQEVRAASGLMWFRPYDTRHTGATRMAECGIAPEIIMARMGHASDRMRRHYTHISMQAQREWLRGQQPLYSRGAHQPQVGRIGPRPDRSAFSNYDGSASNIHRTS